MANNMFANIKGIKNGVATAAGVQIKRGKSSDPNYSQTSVYLKTETLKKAQAKLIEEKFDFSDLVEDLVRNWVNKNSSK
jgi:hypothetical protein